MYLTHTIVPEWLISTSTLKIKEGSRTINKRNNMIWETHPIILLFLFHLFLPNKDITIKVIRSVTKTITKIRAIILLPIK